MQGAQVQSLVGELGSYMPHSVAKKKKEQNLLCVTDQMAWKAKNVYYPPLYRKFASPWGKLHMLALTDRLKTFPNHSGHIGQTHSLARAEKLNFWIHAVFTLNFSKPKDVECENQKKQSRFLEMKIYS